MLPSASPPLTPAKSAAFAVYTSQSPNNTVTVDARSPARSSASRRLGAPARRRASIVADAGAITRMVSVASQKFVGIRPAMHPGWLRCSSFEYSRYAHSSRLAIRAPRRPRCTTNFWDATQPSLDRHQKARGQVAERLPARLQPRPPVLRWHFRRQIAQQRELAVDRLAPSLTEVQVLAGAAEADDGI